MRLSINDCRHQTEISGAAFFCNMFGILFAGFNLFMSYKMRFIRLLLLVCIAMCAACTVNSSKEKELVLRQKELELREKELQLREKELAARNKMSRPDVKKRELRYLYFSNGGIIAYFNDGTIAGCPRCDFIRSNVYAMFQAKTFATYTVEPDGSLLVDKTDRRIPDPLEDEGWALVDYEWHTKVPKE
jgi:hypothetical protein